jgi:hypothetical protein
MQSCKPAHDFFMEEKHQLIPINLDDNRSAAKMGGESGPTGRAIFVLTKTSETLPLGCRDFS